jgi:Protein of unknown function (DUF2796)
MGMDGAFLKRTAIMLACAALCGSALAQGQKQGGGHAHAHTHGVGQLQIAIDGAVVRGELHIPMESLLGHEYLPRSQAQKNAMAQLRQSLTNPAYVMLPVAAAQCQVTNSLATSPMFEGRDGGGHSSLLYAFAFRCEQPQHLRKIDVPLFAKHPRLKEIEVELVGPAVQRALRIKAAQPQLVW